MSTNICVCEEAITLHFYLTEKVFSPFHLPKHLCKPPLAHCVSQKGICSKTENNKHTHKNIRKLTSQSFFLSLGSYFTISARKILRKMVHYVPSCLGQKPSLFKSSRRRKRSSRYLLCDRKYGILPFFIFYLILLFVLWSIL